MRFIHSVTSNEFKQADGEPFFEVVIHSHEGFTNTSGQRNLQEWRFFANQEQLEALVKALDSVKAKTGETVPGSP